MATIQWLNGSHVELQNQKNRKYSPKALIYQGFYYFFLW